MCDSTILQSENQVSVQEILATRIAVSPSIYTPAVTLDCNLQSTTDGTKMMTVGNLVAMMRSGSDIHQRYLDKIGSHPAKEKLYLAAVGLTDGDRVSEIKSTRPGKPTGLVQIDVDHLSSYRDDLDNVISDLCKLPYVLCAFTSPSGTGVKAIAVTRKPSSLQEAKEYGIAVTKAIADYLDLPCYAEGTRKDSDGTAKDNTCFLSDEMKKFKGCFLDFSVGKDPRKGMYIPLSTNIYQMTALNHLEPFAGKDSIDSGWYYQGVNHPWPRTVQPAIKRESFDTQNISVKTPAHRPSTLDDRLQKYVQKAIDTELDTLAAAGSGSHHSTALQTGLAIGKYREIIDIEEIISKAEDIIDNWSPAATSPEVEKRTFRDGINNTPALFDEENWKNEQRQKNAREASIGLDIDIPLVDPIYTPQPEETLSWGEKGLAKYLVKCFLHYYRYAPKGCGVNLTTGEVYDSYTFERMTSFIWEYSDVKGNPKKMSVKAAISHYGSQLGEVTVYPVTRCDLLPHQVLTMRPSIDATFTAPCYNLSEGLPTLGLTDEVITVTAAEEAKTVADFCITRFVDSKSYPDQVKARTVAERECAYYFKYIHQAMTEPSSKPPCAIALLSTKQGTGKSFLTQVLPKILAGSCVTEIPQQSVDNLRFVWRKLVGKVFATFDDFENPQQSLCSTLKTVISSDVVYAEKKGVDGVDELNFSRLFFSSNSREFMKDLNSDSDGSQRRFHIFTCANPLEGDSSADEALSIIKKYAAMQKDLRVLDSDKPELQAFRMALIKEFGERVVRWESSTGEKVNLSRALDTVANRTQAQIGLEHNRVAREAARIVYEMPNQAFLGGARQLYAQVRLAPGCGSLTDSKIRDLLEEAHFLRAVTIHGKTTFKLTEAGLAAVSADDPTGTLLAKWDDIATTRERMETFADLVQDGRITYKELRNDVYEVTVVGHDMMTYEISLRGSDNERDSKVISFTGNPGGANNTDDEPETYNWFLADN